MHELKQFFTNRLTVQKTWKEFLQVKKGKWHWMEIWIYAKEWSAQEMLAMWGDIQYLTLLLKSGLKINI